MNGNVYKEKPYNVPITTLAVVPSVAVGVDTMLGNIIVGSFLQDYDYRKRMDDHTSHDLDFTAFVWFATILPLTQKLSHIAYTHGKDMFLV